LKGSAADPSSDVVEVALSAERLDLADVYRAHAPSVARWAARLGGPSAEIEDLVHEVFVIVERKLPAFRGDALTTWLYRITENVVRHQRRKNRLLSWLGIDMPEHADEAPLPDEAIERKRSIEKVYRILDRMSEKYRTVLILHEIEGLSGPEIAELRGLKPSTVWVQLHRARAMFLAELEKDA
jgi:RNA polymerase sigma-70 factor (ECF subfamily)